MPKAQAKAKPNKRSEPPFRHQRLMRSCEGKRQIPGKRKMKKPKKIAVGLRIKDTTGHSPGQNQTEHELLPVREANVVVQYRKDVTPQ